MNYPEIYYDSELGQTTKYWKDIAAIGEDNVPLYVYFPTDIVPTLLLNVRRADGFYYNSLTATTLSDGDDGYNSSYNGYVFTLPEDVFVAAGTILLSFKITIDGVTRNRSAFLENAIAAVTYTSDYSTSDEVLTEISSLKSSVNSFSDTLTDVQADVVTNTSDIADLEDGTTPAGVATLLGTDTVGSTTQPIYLSEGSPAKITSLAVVYGGTGADNAADARANLNAGVIDTLTLSLSGLALTLTAYDTANTQTYQKTVTMPSAVESASYDSDTEIMTITFTNGSTVEIDVSSIAVPTYYKHDMAITGDGNKSIYLTVISTDNTEVTSITLADLEKAFYQRMVIAGSIGDDEPITKVTYSDSALTLTSAYIDDDTKTIDTKTTTLSSASYTVSDSVVNIDYNSTLTTPDFEYKANYDADTATNMLNNVLNKVPKYWHHISITDETNSVEIYFNLLLDNNTDLSDDSIEYADVINLLASASDVNFYISSSYIQKNWVYSATLITINTILISTGASATTYCNSTDTYYITDTIQPAFEDGTKLTTYTSSIYTLSYDIRNVLAATRHDVTDLNTTATLIADNGTLPLSQAYTNFDEIQISVGNTSNAGELVSFTYNVTDIIASTGGVRIFDFESTSNYLSCYMAFSGTTVTFSNFYNAGWTEMYCIAIRGIKYGF